MIYTDFVEKLFNDSNISEEIVNCLLSKIDIEDKFRNPQILWASNSDLSTFDGIVEATIQFEYIPPMGEVWSVPQTYDVIYFIKDENGFKYIPNPRIKKPIDSVITAYLRQMRIDEILQD